MLSGAIFYKDIESFVQTLVTPLPFNESGLPLSLLAGTTLTGNEVFNFTVPVNTAGGPLEGFEINYQQQFTFLPGFWSNFGTLLNYTYVDSTIDYVTSTTGATPPVENDLVNLSKNAWNATLYYEAGGFSTRASASYRDRYLTAVPAANAPTIQDAEGTNETSLRGLLGCVRVHRQLHRVARSAEPHGRVQRSVHRHRCRSPGGLHAHRSPAVPRCALQVLSIDFD